MYRRGGLHRADPRAPVLTGRGRREKIATVPPAPREPMPSADDLRLETFQPHLGETFRLRLEGLQPLALELVEARGEGGDSDSREPFSLLFLGPPEPVLDQMIRRLDHDRLGTLHLFLVPLGPDRERQGVLYEAVFS